MPLKQAFRAELLIEEIIKRGSLGCIKPAHDTALRDKIIIKLLQREVSRNTLRLIRAVLQEYSVGKLDGGIQLALFIQSIGVT